MRIVVCAGMLIVSLLGGCVTETTRGPMTRADEEQILQSQIQLGVGYLSNRNFQRAKENLQKALEIDPKSALAHNYFGLLYQLELDPEQAEEHFSKAVRYAPDLAVARNNYGAFLFEQGRYEEAIEQLEVAAEDRLYRNRAAVYENLGVAWLQTGKHQAAEEAFQKAIALNANQSRALLELADIRFEQERYPEALDYYSRHVKSSSQSARSLWLGIRLARVFGNEDQEASLALALKNIFPASPQYQAYKQSLGGDASAAAGESGQ